PGRGEGRRRLARAPDARGSAVPAVRPRRALAVQLAHQAAATPGGAARVAVARACDRVGRGEDDRGARSAAGGIELRAHRGKLVSRLARERGRPSGAGAARRPRAVDGTCGAGYQATRAELSLA